jgi:TolB-like protein
MIRIALPFLLMSVAFSAFAQDKKTIAIMPFKSRMAGMNDATMIANTLGTMLAAKGKFKVVDRDHMDKVLAETQLKVLMASQDELIIIAQMVSADFIVVGEMGRLGSKMNLNVRFIDVGSAEVVLAKRLSWSDPDALEELLQGLANELSGEEAAKVAFDPKFGLHIWRGIDHNVCRARRRHQGRITKNLAGNVSINLGAKHFLAEGNTVGVFQGGEEVGEIELTKVGRSTATGLFVATTAIVAARPGMIVRPHPIRLAVATFTIRGAAGFDPADATKQVISQLKGSDQGCVLGKRRAVKKWDSMSDRRKARMGKKVDAVVTGTILTRRGRMVAEIQLVNPRSGGIVAQFSAQTK